MKVFAFPALAFACIVLAVQIFTVRLLDTTARFHIPAPAISLDDVIHAAAHKHRIPTSLVKSIIAAESNFAPNAASPKGAIGLMQLMAETAHELGADPTVPEQNVDAGAHYLSTLLRRFAGNRSCATPSPLTTQVRARWSATTASRPTAKHASTSLACSASSLITNVSISGQPAR